VDNAPIRVIRPLPVPAQFFVWGILVTGIVSLAPALIVGNIVQQDREFTKDWNRNVPAELRKGEPGTFPWGIAVFAGCFLAGASLAGLTFLYAPRYTEYRIFPNRAEYYQGLFNRTQRTVVFDQVIDVKLSEGVLQQTKGVGTITLITKQLVSVNQGQLTNRTFSMRNVPEPQQVYEQICALALRRESA
jgi:Bacterial PH domain